MKFAVVLPVLVTAGLLAGCSSPEPEGRNASTTGSAGAAQTKTPDAKKVLVGLVFDKGGLGDKSFNDSANRGLQAAKAKYGVDVQAVDSKSESEYETNLEALAEKGAGLVIGVGISMKDAIEAAAKKYPNVKFAIVDASVTAPNVRSLLFKEEEGSYLVGYIAGEMTKTNKIGFVGGMELPLIKKFEYGYAAGAKAANPKVELLPAKYTGDWVNVDLGKTAAKSLFSSGADVVYAAAGRAGLGVITAAQEDKKFAIGVDSDQDELAPGSVLTSMIKHVDTAVQDTIGSVVEGKFEAGEKTYDLKADGVGVSEFKFTKDVIGAEKIKALDAVKADIIAGKIKVPTNEAEFKAFTPPAPAAK